MTKRFLVTGLLGMMLFCMTAASQASVLTFDDLTSFPFTTVIDNGYGGFNWTDMWLMNPTTFGGPSGFANGVVSGPNVAFNAFERQGVVSGSLFDFNGAYLTAGWNNGLHIDVRGYLGGVLKYDSTVVVDTTAPTFFRFDFLGIDNLTFDSFGGTPAGFEETGNTFALDNFTFNESTAIPEPSTLVLFVAGLVAAAYFSKRMSRYR